MPYHVVWMHAAGPLHKLWPVLACMPKSQYTLHAYMRVCSWYAGPGNFVHLSKGVHEPQWLTGPHPGGPSRKNPCFGAWTTPPLHQYHKFLSVCIAIATFRCLAIAKSLPWTLEGQDTGVQRCPPSHPRALQDGWNEIHPQLFVRTPFRPN